MQIGAFAKLCGTKISVLRHYDKTGLLHPDYTDRFTGYRYYAKEQVTDFLKISALKAAGFSLSEIRAMLTARSGTEAILEAFEKKKAALEEALLQLDEAKKTLLGVEQIMKIKIIGAEDGLLFYAAPGRKIDAEIRAEVDRTIAAQGYQRVSAFQVRGTEAEPELACQVLLLTETEQVLQEDIDLPFENDDTVIGKWVTVGEFAVWEDFCPGADVPEASAEIKEIYFLPDGERYWCFGWTKGKLLVDDGVSTSVHPFETETIDGTRYMFVSLKSYHYRHGGQPTVLVLRQADNKAYTAQGIARKDDIDRPFVPDDAVLGKWKTVGFCADMAAFVPGENTGTDWYLAGVEFRSGGAVTSLYDFGRDVIDTPEMQTWTKGYILRKWNHSACAYEIRVLDGNEYLFLEWKSGDYRWGGFDTDYYVLERA